MSEPLSADDHRHGTRNSYQKHKCRCDGCRAAAAAYARARNQQRSSTPRNPADYFGDGSERWMPIPEWEGVYEVSDLGRVRSVPRRWIGRNGQPQAVRGRIRKHVHGRGPWDYPTINLTDSQTDRSIVTSVHILVALTFIGPRPEGMQVRHRNGDYDDPRLVNLEYGTPSENMYDAVRHGTHVQAKKTHCPQDHPLSGENLYVHPAGRRVCRTCASAAGRRWRERRQEVSA